MGKENLSPIQKRCIACKENIMPDALICPRCRSAQAPQRWMAFFSILKWIGGVTAIISLIVGVRQVGGIVKDWKERDEAVHQVVMASSMLLEMKDYKSAWEIVKKATTIAPSSQKAFNQQVDVAMVWLRDIWVQKEEKTYSEIVGPLIFVLSQGSGDKNRHRAARILAHIGWANCLRLRDKKADYEVDGYLLKALKYNSEDTYANLFRGYWLLSRSNKSPDDQNGLADALKHFSKALKTGENPYFVNKWCIIALRRSNVDGAGEEAVKIVNEWRKQKKIPLEPSQQKSILGIVLEQFSRYDYKSPEKTFLPRLITLLPAREIKETYLWLIEQSGRQENERLILYRLGLISEVDGDFQTAFNHYIEIIERLKTSNRGHYPLLGKKALCRLLTKGLKKEVIFSNVQIMDIPKNIIALGDTIEMGMTFARNNSLSIGSINEGPAKKGGLMIGDNFLMIDNVLFESRYKFNKILKDIVSENRSYADLFLLRDGKIISYRFVKEK